MRTDFLAILPLMTLTASACGENKSTPANSVAIAPTPSPLAVEVAHHSIRSDELLLRFDVPWRAIPNDGGQRRLQHLAMSDCEATLSIERTNRYTPETVDAAWFERARTVFQKRLILPGTGENREREMVQSQGPTATTLLAHYAQILVPAEPRYLQEKGSLIALFVPGAVVFEVRVTTKNDASSACHGQVAELADALVLNAVIEGGGHQAETSHVFQYKGEGHQLHFPFAAWVSIQEQGLIATRYIDYSYPHGPSSLHLMETGFGAEAGDRNCRRKTILGLPIELCRQGARCPTAQGSNLPTESGVLPGNSGGRSLHVEVSGNEEERNQWLDALSHSQRLAGN